MAASRYLDHLARQIVGAEAADLFRQASQLSQTARQHELAAWELAAREAVARPRDSRSPAIRAIEARAAELAKEDR
jgi:hypothetical protein